MKKLLSMLLVLALLLSVTACSGEQKTETNAADSNAAVKTTDEKIVIRVGTATEIDSHYTQGAQEFEKKVEEYTNGKVDVQIFPSGQLGNERDMIEGLSLGTLEMVVSSTGPLPNFSKDFQVFDLPFLITDREKAYEVMDGEIGQKILGTLEPLGIKALGFWENGFRNISNNSKEIVTPADVAGMKIRTMENPIHIATFQQMKAIPTPMAWSEVFTALQQGTIDGQENPLVIFNSNKLYEAQKYLSLTGHVYSPAVMMVSLDAFNSYPNDVQNAIIKAEQEARTWERNFCIKMDNELVDAIKSYGVTVTEVDKSLWQEACQPIYDQYASEINQDYVNALKGN
ncbi:MAG: TRAP transporter substrate-binding protein [Sedimentibacter sp.]|uniref:TRAP transporter substrate-binding protein n=1 Tax=Sedimentibacter sp. TaxID=1960295 RepID=UPI002980BD59|nr:TRAP transporter substrate-binding protein [Sedimentibacter sp.]MDW5299850.1 TRAP transporter substrate-binding protein [Sedimentibacter sp.]